MSKLHLKAIKQQSAGFTIIELLMATLVFSIILVLLTTGVIQITDTYYKGISESSAQQSARNILSDLTQSVEYLSQGVTYPPTSMTDPQNPAVTINQICIGNQQLNYIFDYGLNKSLTSANSSSNVLQSPSVLVENSGVTNCANTAPQNIAETNHPTGQELMGNKTRLVNLQIVPVGAYQGLYYIDVRVVYGDTELLNSSHNQCDNVQGSKFCASAELSTYVVKRAS